MEMPEFILEYVVYLLFLLFFFVFEVYYTFYSFCPPSRGRWGILPLRSVGVEWSVVGVEIPPPRPHIHAFVSFSYVAPILM